MEPPQAVSKRETDARILGFATQGSDGDDELRLRTLLAPLAAEVLPFDRSRKISSLFQILQRIRKESPSLVLMEGTGIGGGLAVLAGRWFYGVPFVVSSGDAVGPFLSGKYGWGNPLFHLYERVLCRSAKGFVGWSPYLSGRALTLGARRAMTAPGWAPFALTEEQRQSYRSKIRQKFDIRPSAIVFGIAGSLAWSKTRRYCYGLELVKALQQTSSDACVLIVGDGDGYEILRRLAGSRLNKSIFLAGRVGRSEVPKYLSAMDVGLLPQSVDGIGSFRYTTKISEYVAAKLPFITNQIPAAYDMDSRWMIRLPGDAPWDRVFVRELASLMDNAKREWMDQLRSNMPDHAQEFDRERQVARFCSFVSDLLIA